MAVEQTFTIDTEIREPFRVLIIKKKEGNITV